MRVIWISLGIFIAVFAISLGLHDPELNQQITESSGETAKIDNPFVEDEPAKQTVDLAALQESPQADVAPSSTTTVPDSSTTETEPGNTEQAQSIQPVQQNGHNLVPEADLTDNQSVEAAATIDSTAQPSSEPEEKQLGLLAKSAERRRNKNKVAIIVHKENDQSLTEHEIRAMYMDRLTQWKDGSKVMLYNLPLGDKHREKFSQQVLNMSALQADEAESLRRENNVMRNLVRVKAKNIIVSYVERHPNAIAYVPLSMVRDRSNVKVVMTLP